MKFFYYLAVFFSTPNLPGYATVYNNCMCDRAGVQQCRAVQLNYKKLLQVMESNVDRIM